MRADSEFDRIEVGEVVAGRPFTVSRETIRTFAEGSLDWNPLHFDDDYMRTAFGKTTFKGVIMHGMQNFALMTRTLTDWLVPRGGLHRRLETRWLRPVYPGDTITASATVSGKKRTGLSRWITFDVQVRNQNGELVATGEAMAELPDAIPGGPAA